MQSLKLSVQSECRSILVQVVEVLYGLMISCDVAYLTYLYATVPTELYPRVSALCRVAHLLGRLLSGLIGQVMISTQLLDYLQLQYISVTSTLKVQNLLIRPPYCIPTANVTRCMTSLAASLRNK